MLTRKMQPSNQSKNPVTSIRLPEPTRNQIDELVTKWSCSMANIMTIAIDRMYQQEIGTMSSKYDYSVIEDNGGGLHLFLFRPGTEEIVMGFTGFEYAPGSLTTSLDSLETGDTARSWDGKMDDAQAQWDYIHDNDSGYQVICYGENGERILKPDRMGRAGQIEFGVTAE